MPDRKNSRQVQTAGAGRACTVACVFLPAVCLLLLPTVVMVFDFGDRGKRYLNDLAISAFDLDARGCECLSGFHAADKAPHALTIYSYNLDIVFAV